MKRIRPRTWSFGSILFDIANALLMLLLCATTLYPFLFLLNVSLNASDVSFTTIKLIPESFTLENYRQVMSEEHIRTGFANAVVRTVLGTSLTLVTTIAAAYALSKPYYPHRTFWTQLIILTMFFSGGLIPTYLLVKDLGLLNTVWALVLPPMVSAFQLIVTRNFLQTLPIEVEESAKIDGANDLYILWKIVIPLSMPIVITLGLWNIVGHWNAWFDSMLYMTKQENEVLQVVMRRIVLDGEMDMLSTAVPEVQRLVNPETLKAATIMVTTLPIILIYPFVQKYFVKGMLIGSVKG